MSLYKNQKELKPRIEDVARVVFEGDKLKNLLDFVVFLRNNKMAPRWQSVNSWVAGGVCYIKIFDDENLWWVSPNLNFGAGEYEKHITDDEMKELVWGNLHNRQCRTQCSGYIDKALWGKKFDRICFCFSVRIKNPEGAALECLKKMILLMKTVKADLEKARAAGAPQGLGIGGNAI